MQSKYKGICRLCQKPIAVGDEIDYSKESGASHASCGDGDLGESGAAERLADELGFDKGGDLI